ncbi:SAM-dependent methyltransferase [Amycolatopsis sp. CA-230715]|uniref:SAM-dependent methyltransferase n=1 Tax=Amycolatopsis sp. CA-230715 TaxID=2745196 RepID=UPI001C0096B8|nr:SAM-dependent methyltransferase [Amycolatopsis sp. CA-230715]QWF85896.1 hypothetical protein HUW46_09376 [Amycolatopsis sp. CA-230715]
MSPKTASSPLAWQCDRRIREQRFWSECPRVDVTGPHVARVEVAVADPTDIVRTWPCDREVATQLATIAPYTETALRTRHQFTSTVIEHALAQGITQFLELGSGDPHISSAHAAIGAVGTTPAPRIVLVDHDPIVYARAWGDAQEQPGAWRRSTFVRGNVFAVGRMVNSLAKRGLLDLELPVCVLAVDILHFAEPEIDVRTVPRRLAHRLVPGTLIAVTHLTDEPLTPPTHTRAVEDLRTDTASWCRAHGWCVGPQPRPRSHAEFARLLADLELLAPGTTTPGSWPEPDDTRQPRAPYTLAAVGRVPKRRAGASERGEP